MREALRADLGSGGKRGPFSEYFLSQFSWRQSTASWGLENRELNMSGTKKHLWTASVRTPRELDWPLAGSNLSPLPRFQAQHARTHCGWEGVWAQAALSTAPSLPFTASCLFS